jgi:hypothetical protein
MTPFQCEQCHFRNIMGRDVLDGVNENVELVEIMRRANLDAFWERASSTAGSNLRAGMHGKRTSERLRMPSLTPPMGFSLWTIHWECVLRLLYWTGPWILELTYDDFVQWETFRHARSAVTNISQAGVYGLGALAGAYKRRKMWITDVVIRSFWFSRFIPGVHKRVGEMKKRDEATTINVVHAIQDILHAE